MIKKLILYYNTLKYLKPVQIYGRIFSLIKKKTFSQKINFNQIPEYSPLSPKTEFLNHDPWNSRENLLKGEFTFLNNTQNLSFPPNWLNPDQPLLWQFNLHYMNYLHLLHQDEKELIVNNWIDYNPKGISPAWHPYVISLRLISLLKETWHDQKIISSIALQAEYLYHNLEFYHPANHYLENARALIFAGQTFENSKYGIKWLKKGKEIYKKELPKQVLPDGCYFEKSPMYHNIILHGLLDLLNILNEEDEFYVFIKEYTEKMLQFANKLIFSNGNIPLFNDSTYEIAPKTTDINEYSVRINKSLQKYIIPEFQYSWLSDSGYFIHKNNDLELIADFGCIGPDFIPAHAHADIFTYELYYKGLPFVVDTGVYEYQNGEMRDYSRSTKAHNTISIGGKDQAEMWGGFRVGERFQPENVSLNEENEIKRLSGEYKGWSKLIGDNLIHKRIIETSENSLKIIDEVTGNGNHLIENFIHLHPDVEIKQENQKIELINKNVSIQLLIHNSNLPAMAEFQIQNSFFFTSFGQRIINKTIKIILIVNQKINYSFNF
jgi:uncharacterized heparinase superfamily protein